MRCLLERANRIKETLALLACGGRDAGNKNNIDSTACVRRYVVLYNVVNFCLKYGRFKQTEAAQFDIFWLWIFGYISCWSSKRFEGPSA